MSNALSENLLSVLSGKVMHDYSCTKRDRRRAAAITLGQIYAGYFEWDSEQRKNLTGKHRGNYNIHTANPYCHEEACSLLGVVGYEKPSIGSKILIQVLAEKLGSSGYQELPLNENYAIFRVDQNKPIIEFLMAVGLREDLYPVFQRSAKCLPNLHDMGVSTGREVQHLQPLSESRPYNECIVIDNKFIYNNEDGCSEKYKCRVVSSSMKTNHPYCVMKSGCANRPKDHDWLTGGHTSVYFGTNSPELALQVERYRGNEQCIRSFYAAAGRMDASLGEEHLISRDECSNLGIDFNFPENLRLACRVCNSCLSNKPLDKKIRLLLKCNSAEYVRPIYEGVMNGLRRLGKTSVLYSTVADNYECIRKEHGWIQ